AAGFALSDGQSNKSAPLNPGTYSVSETPLAGWDLTGATCDNGNSTGAITLAAGQTLTCTFTNTQRGHIIVKKVTNPGGSSQSFATPLRCASCFPSDDGQTDNSVPLTAST